MIIYIIVALSLFLCLIILFLSIKFSKTAVIYKQFRYLFENDKDNFVFVYDFLPKEKFVYISHNSESINGYTPEEHYKNPELLKNLVHLDDFPVFEYWKNFPHLTNHPIVMRWIKKDGQTIWTEQRYSTIVKRNKIVSVVGMIKDITKQKNIEFALRENEEKYRKLFENANDFIFLILGSNDEDEFNILEINDIAQARFCEDGKNFLIDKIVAPKYYYKFRERLFNLGNQKAVNFETVFVDKNDYKLDIDVNASAFHFHGKKIITLIARNVTEKRKIENEIQKNQKLDSLSILSGSIAHDFNNLLTAILGNISLMRFETKDTNMFEKLSEVESVIHRAKNLTQRLLSFSKNDCTNKRPGYLTRIIKDASNFISTGSIAKCIFDIDEDLKIVDFDETQIVQVINSLILNAIQSMSKGGTIQVSAKNIFLSSDLVLPIGEFVNIKITDHGSGIEKENLDKIFDPFFTTKEKAVGLGLTSTYSIIKRHDGNIQVESQVGKGTTFSIFLPVSAKNKEERICSEEIKIQRGKGKILLMDDNKEIREVAEKILNYLGYTALTVLDGTEALNKFIEAKDNKSPFDLLILDMTIQGGMGGKDTITELLKLDPNVKALVSTGYTEDIMVTDFKNYGFCDIISKPYTLENISSIIYKHITK